MIKNIFLSILALSTFVFAQHPVDQFADAVKLFNEKEYSAAYNIFKKFSNDNSLEIQRQSSAKFYSGECLINLGEYDGAAIEFEEFLDLYPFSNFKESTLYKLGTIYITNGEFRKAREDLTFMINSYPQSEDKGSACYWIGEAYVGENNFVEAEDFFQRSITEYQTNKYIVNSYFSLGMLYEKLNNFTKATANYDELLAYYKNHPLAPRAQFRIGVCYFNLKEYDSAVLELSDPLIKKLPKEERFEADYFLASSFTRLKEYNNAADIYKEILQGNISNELKDKINYSLAWVNFQLNNYNEAYNIFSQLQKSASDTLSINAFFWSGECKRYLGDTEAANEIYKSFIEKHPSSSLASRAQLALGSIYYGSKNSADAEKALLNASISNDELTKGKANTILGEMQLNQKQYEKANDYFKTAVKFTVRSKELNNRALLGLGVTEFYLNNIDEAVGHLENIKNNAKDFEADKVNFYLAECYLSRGEYSAALRLYNSINSGEDNLIKQVTYGKAYAYFNIKDFPNAIYYFNEFITKYKNDSNINDARLRLADSYFGIKDFNKASVIYSEIFSRNRNSLNSDVAYYQYCQSLYKAGKSSDAIEEFQNLQDKFPRSKYADASQYVIGWIYFQRGNYSEAINNYNRLLSKYPRSQLVPIAFYSLGDSYFNVGNYDTSIVFYNKVLEEYPNTPYILDAVNGIQYAYVAKEQPNEALTFIDNFINSNPASKFGDQIYFKKGDILYSAEKYNFAIQAYQDFIQKYPTSNLVPNAYFWIGKSAANLKKTADAINNFNSVTNKWLASDIGLSATIELANIYSIQKDYTNAIRVLETATKAMPNSNRLPELLYLKGSSEASANKQQEAYQTFDQVIKYYDSSVFAAKAKVELGILELNRKNFDNALVLFKEVGEKRTDDIGAQAQYNYGVTLYNQDKITDAITALVRVRSVFSGFDEWYTKSLLKLGDCYVKLKDKTQAREMYRAVIERHKTGDLAQEAKRKLNQL